MPIYQNYTDKTRHTKISEIAYFDWLNDGCKFNNDLYYWLNAEKKYIFNSLTNMKVTAEGLNSLRKIEGLPIIQYSY